MNTACKRLINYALAIYFDLHTVQPYAVIAGSFDTSSTFIDENFTYTDYFTNFITRKVNVIRVHFINLNDFFSKHMYLNNIRVRSYKLFRIRYIMCLTIVKHYHLHSFFGYS